MNIIVQTFGSKLCYCRPDTTWEREEKDFYVPDGIDTLYWTPVVFARVCKAGKCIGKKFASRYYDAIGFGTLLYTFGKEKGELAFASCTDHTSLLPTPAYTTIEAEEEKLFEVFRNGESIFGSLNKRDIEEAICMASELTSLRIGDFVAVELAQMQTLISRAENEAEFKAVYDGKKILDIKIVY